MTDIEHARKYAEESICLSISMYNPKAEEIARMACLYGLTYKNDKIKELKEQIEKMKCCGNCKHHRYDYGELECVTKGCKNKSKWELAE